MCHGPAKWCAQERACSTNANLDVGGCPAGVHTSLAGHRLNGQHVSRVVGGRHPSRCCRSCGHLGVLQVWSEPWGPRTDRGWLAPLAGFTAQGLHSIRCASSPLCRSMSSMCGTDVLHCAVGHQLWAQPQARMSQPFCRSAARACSVHHIAARADFRHCCH